MQQHHTAAPHRTIRRYWLPLITLAEAGTTDSHPTTSLARWIPPTVIAERDRLARIERLERSELAPGERPVPVDLDAVDALASVVTETTATVLTVEDAVRRSVGLTLWARDDRHPLTVIGACSDIDVIARRLLDDRQREWIDSELDDAATAVLHAVGLDPTPMILRHPCPGCGERLLLDAAHDLGPHVRCAGPVDCIAMSRIRVHGHPWWEERDFAQLGHLLDDGTEPTAVALIDAAEIDRRARVATAVPTTGDPQGRTIAGVTDAA